MGIHFIMSHMQNNALSAWLKEANFKDFEQYKEQYNKKPKHEEHQAEFKLAIKEALSWRKNSSRFVCYYSVC